MSEPIYSTEPNGIATWHLDGQLHHEKEPAIEYPNGTKVWMIRGKYHRENGPAIFFLMGYYRWYLDGKNIAVNSQEEFERYKQLKAFW